ncbi:hypothetical protein MADP07_00631 [Mycoplasma anatis]|uniref:Uncharacterized protein n=2 Tax=Mycoplasmopsis anatis TaxID=171279 RepID=A0A9Q3LBC1_9BACT|nr:hypothetical protein [Mycoplasmopsis anatis]MBW0597118.1 hypothetical protein [Mycoplasmopsis anatis]MBW0597867.1 hypothetical protein [Mycoplasmopsis anatis]MBW0600036.1 hypothetical protein [Mycoplasmopsis anatis]MBW0600789.1 hypothetical protein [Mycoplasmopsis anatis]
MSYRVITYVKERNESGQYVDNQYLINSVVEKVDFIDNLNEEQRNVYDELVKERQKLISLAYNSPQKVIFQEYNAYQLKRKIINEESFIYPIMISKFIFTIDFVLKNPNYLSKENLYFIVGDRTKTPSQWSQLDSIVVLEDRLYKLLK